ncbi:uncharacterized protein B0H18DRAFT_888328, partial [Fomitopsis serialis]|uniref:uncharacterized protein n=1 Tax=Fomitopsis serialis TaxID=139415 RepID=UPI0020080313
LRKISVSIHRSPTLLLPSWRKAIEELEMEFRKLPRDVRTRWNSTFRMLVAVLEYREAIEKMTATQANGLRRWELSEREWEIATQLRDVFYDATQFFSREGEEAPDLTDVIPSMDLIDHQLATDAINTDLDPAIRVAIGMAKRTINRYYDKSDESAAYRIAMGTSSLL